MMHSNPYEPWRFQFLHGSNVPLAWAPNIHILDEADSTNNIAKEMARNGAPHGTVVVADRQTAGRGRLGRTFYSPGGLGLYYSVILRPECPPQDLMHLTCVMAMAACGAVHHVYGFRPQIKWINDLVYEGKKLGGILTELSVNPKSGLVDYAIVGIGINCRHTIEEFDPAIRDMACSVRMIKGHDVDRNPLVACLTDAIHTFSTALLTNRAQMMEAYRKECITLGREISILRGDEVFHGTALSVDDEGGLLVRLDSGEIQTVTSGEVSIRGLYGYI